MGERDPSPRAWGRSGDGNQPSRPQQLSGSRPSRTRGRGPRTAARARAGRPPAQVGGEVKGIKAGDRVMCAGGGGYAGYAVADWGRVYPLPAQLSFEQGATLPVALQTMHNALVTAGRLAAGESVLIQGASSGVGLIGMQIAKHMGAGLVIGSSTDRLRPDK